MKGFNGGVARTEGYEGSGYDGKGVCGKVKGLYEYSGGVRI